MDVAALFSGLILGFAGSLHCIGMCGPLMLLLPSENKWREQLQTQGFYHLGKTVTYMLLGGIAGVLFIWVDIRAFEQQFSIALGLAFLVLWGYDFWGKKQGNTSKLQQWVNKAFSKALGKKASWGWFLGGLLNGLLPCGLVYGALLASLGTGSLFGTVSFMFGFGLATAPALIGVSLTKSMFVKKLSPYLRKALPFWLLIMAAFFLLRGANLGIPFLSPKFQTHQSNGQNSNCCH